MHVELTKPAARLHSFVNSDGEVELAVQMIAGAEIAWQGTLSGAEALQLAQQIEEAARFATLVTAKRRTMHGALKGPLRELAA